MFEVQERLIELQQQQLEVIGKGFERLVQCIFRNPFAFSEQSAFSAQSACGLPLLSTSHNVLATNGSPPMVSALMITVTILRSDNTKTDILDPLASELSI